MRKTLRDVARKAGVSYSSVSKILNGDKADLFAEATVQKVKAAARDLGYSSNPLARSLKTGRTGLIGVAGMNRQGIAGFSDPYLAETYAGINNYFATSGSKMVFHGCDSDSGMEEMLRLIHTHVVDGHIFILFTAQVPQFMKTVAPVLYDEKEKFVVIHSMDMKLDCTAVGLASREACAEGTRHLIGHGYKSIGFVGRQSLEPLQSYYMDGFKDALSEAGMNPNKAPVFASESFTTQTGKTLAEDMLAQKMKLPRALYVADYGVADGMIDVFTRNGIRVPEDCAFMTTGNNPREEFGLNHVTTMLTNGYERGYQASRMLHEMLITGNDRKEQVLVKSELKTAGSCGCS